MSHHSHKSSYIDQIGLGTIGRETFEVHNCPTILFHDIIQHIPTQSMWGSIIGLRVTTCNREDFAVFSIVHMTCNFIMLDVVKYYLGIFFVPSPVAYVFPVALHYMASPFTFWK